MSIPELIYRIYQKGSSTVQQYGFFTANKPPEPIFTSFDKKWISISNDVDLKSYTKNADKILDGSINIFSLKYDFNDTPNWNYNKSSDENTPLSFGKTIDYRDSDQAGDVKYVWEPNRHLHLIPLAQAFALTKNEKYSNALNRHLLSWIDQCPYSKGLNWTSSLELGIRLINWSIVWQLINTTSNSVFNSPSGKILKDKWIDSIYQHCHFINGHLSLYSSANNHLIGEVTGLFIASITWPYWKESSAWSDKAQKILTQESLKQNYSDGVNKEQAIHYQQYVIDYLLFSGLAARSANRDFSQEYWDRIEKMIEFIASVMDVEGNIPMTGDTDGGYVSDLSQELNFCPYKSLLATGAVLFGRTDFKSKAVKFDDKSKWLLGDNAKEIFESLQSDKSNLLIQSSFSNAGYYILGTDFETDSEIRMLVDAGPLGYLSIAAHGHADALSFTLSVSGKEFLIDPGTYAYHTQKKWRDYFRGTSAHNTVRIDGVDQSVSGGNFMWVKHANSECIEWSDNENEAVFLGKHDGYKRLEDPVIHSRKIKFDKRQKSFFITDILECEQTHTAERFWHFSEKCTITVTGDGAIIAINADKKVIIKPIQDVEVIVFRGDKEKPLGWVSRNYDVKEPITTVVWSNAVNGTCKFDTLVECRLS